MASTNRKRRRESGMVLLIAIFVMMLVSVVAIALVVSSGTESALAANYRSSSTVYYAALAGLEEARGRLQPKNPDYFNIAKPNFMPPAGTPLQLTQVRYIRNQAPGEVVNPTDSSNPYYDGEYASEFNNNPITNVPDVQIIDSISGNNAAGIPGPVFKWVRINAVTKASLNINVDGGPPDQTTLLNYDPLHTDGYGTTEPSLIVNATPPASAVQALEITALAVLPNGSKKLLQTVAAPTTLGFVPLAALTMLGSSGNNVSFAGPGTGDFYVDGRDHFAVNSCVPGPNPVTAIGYAGGTDPSGITAAPAPNYPGIGGTTTVASVGALTFPFSNPNSLEAKIQDVAAQGADAVLTPSPPLPAGTFHTYHPSDILSAVPDMDYGHPKTIYVNGNLDMTNWHNSGYGLLIVTGQLTYDPDANWFGMVFVIGQGQFVSTKHGTGQFQGAMLIAQTRDNNGAIKANFGPASFSETGSTSSGYGIYYSSCWINYAQPRLSYKVLSFREIPQ